MLTPNVLLFWTVLCFHSTQGDFELPLDITAAIDVLGRVTDQIVAGNDSKLIQEFGDVFEYLLNLTQLETEGREEVNRLTTSNSTKDDDDDVAWQTALNDALDEENITTEINTTLREEVKLIESIATKPENLKLTYIRSVLTSRKDNIEDEVADDSDELAEERNKDYNPFWDVTLTRRIYKGKKTKIREFPFVASVHIFKKFACAASIIKSDLVITAASCLQLAHNNRFFRENPAFLSVRVGSPFTDVGGDWIHVFEVYFHPTYEPKTLVHNLAIMRLVRHLNFRHRKVKKIDFDRSPTALAENTFGITIVGWGSKSVSNKIKFQTRLHTADLDFYDTQSCREIYGKKFVTRTNFCAGFITKAEGACNRDVGDPGVSGKYLMGVTSFGSPICGKVDTPTVFTKLGYYADWIEDIMALEVPKMSGSTTTRKPFYLISKKIKLYGGEGELEPIPLLREAKNGKTEPNQDFNSRPVGEDGDPAMQGQMNTKEEARTAENENNYPDVEADPEIINQVSDTEKIRNQPPTIIETENTLMDYQQSDGNSQEGQTMKSVELTTSIADYEPNQQGIDMGVETVARTLKPPEIYDMFADIADSPNRPVTGMSNADAEETMPDFNTEMDVSTTDNSFITNMIENEDVWVDNENYTALRKIQQIPPVDSQVEDMNKIDNQTKTINDIISSYIDANGKSVELRDVHEKIEDIDINVLEDQNSLPENQKEIQPHQPQTKFQEEIADEMVKREIQKLLSQLEISSELSSITEDRRLTNNTPLHNLANHVSKDGANASNTVLTFLYLTDGEKEANARATLDISENEGLSIDPVPFQRSMRMQRRNDLVGKSEIYEIFAKVMDTVVSNTTG